MMSWWGWLLDQLPGAPPDTPDTPEPPRPPKPRPPTPSTPSTPNPTDFLSPHFRATEFACNHCGQLPLDKYPPEQLLGYLEDVREHFGNKPVVVNSGYRCVTHNRNVGGARESLHLVGKATDFYIVGVSNKAIQAYCDRLIGDNGGVGSYDTFTHIDVRGYKARWSG